MQEIGRQVGGLGVMKKAGPSPLPDGNALSRPSGQR